MPGNMLDDLMDCDIVPQKCAPRYFPTLCSICYSTKEGKVKRCSGCKVVPYCGPEHAKTGWKLHKHVCQALAATRQLLVGPYEDGHEPGHWNYVRASAINTLQIMCGRPLMEQEKEAFLFPYACDYCHKCHPHAELFECDECKVVSYCSKQCQEKGKAHHDKYCWVHSLSAHIMAEINENGYMPPIFCENVHDAPLLPLKDSFKEHLAARRWGPMDVLPPASQYLCFLFTTDALSYPLSVVYGLSKAGLGRGGAQRIEDMEELTLHVVGAGVEPELAAVTKYEEFLHILPRLQRVNMVFVGIDLGKNVTMQYGEVNHDDLLCPDCSRRGRRIRYFHYSGSFQDYVRDSAGEWHSNPTALVAYNCGFHEYPMGSPQDTWTGALRLMLSNPDVPLVFTSYTQTEANSDLQRVESLGGTAAMTPERNAYMSYIPIRDWERDNGCDFFYNNQYITVVRGPQP